MTPQKIYKNRDSFGKLVVTNEFFESGFFRKKRYEVKDVNEVASTERNVTTREKLAPVIAGLILIGAAILIAVINSNGYFCAGIVGILGFSFLLLGLTVQKMFDINIKMKNGIVFNETLPANYREREFLDAVQKLVKETHRSTSEQ